MHIEYFTKELEILNKRIFFSKEHKVMFLTTPKCGSQFIKLFCLLNFTKYTTDNNNVESKFRFWSNTNTITLKNLNDPSIQKFQIVRNPYERFLSYITSNFDKFPKNERKNLSSSYIKSVINVTLKTINEPHPDKLKLVGQTGKEDTYSQFYEHIFPQYSWLFSKYFTPIKLEKIDELLEQNPDYFLPKKTSFKHHTKYQYEIEMDQEMKDKIYDLYAYDFIKLNYEK